MRWTALPLSILLSGGLGCSSTASAGKGASPPPAVDSDTARPAPKLQPPKGLPIQAREMLAVRMQRHGEEMMYLTAMVLTLNYEGAVELAELIAEEPRIGRLTPDEHGTISELLPERFFVLQDELNERAKAMAVAARTKTKNKMLEAYGRLTDTCVSCHEAYLQNEGGPDYPGFGGEQNPAEHEPLE